MRKFESGATRDDVGEKLDYEGFLSPIVLRRFAQYMHEHRKQADEKMRDSDNWQKGIPISVYMKSKWRHFMTTWRCHRHPGYGDIEESLCAELFNTMGMLFEVLRIGKDGQIFYPHFCRDCNQSWLDKDRVKVCRMCGSENVVNDIKGRQTNDSKKS